MGEFILVTIQVDMHDRLALTLQDDLTSQIVKHRSRGVLIDISALEIVDSFIGRMLKRDGKDADIPNRIYGTVAAETVAILKGVHIIRTHDVRACVDAARIADVVA